MDEKVELKEENLGRPQNYEMTIHDHRAYRLVYFILGVLEVLFAFRFIFKLLGANPENFFAKLIYGITGIFLTPFSGLFRSGVTSGIPVQRVFEPATIIAMIVYALLALAIAKGLLIFRSKPTPPSPKETPLE